MNYVKYTTKFGLRIILSPRKETGTATVALFCGAGSRYENKINNGISHFIEHLTFKGTTRRPTTLDISKELDGVGAVFNAYTGKDHTNYYIKIASEKIELAFDILSDMLLNSKFDFNDIAKEKGVILEEMKMYEDNPTFYIEDLFENLIFQNHELGRHIIGTRDNIKKIGRKLIMKYLSEFYQPKNMALVVAGNFSESAIKKLVGGYFRFKIKGKKAKIKKFINRQIKPRIFLLNKNTEQVHLTLGFPAYHYNHKNLMAFYILAVILGGNMSSRLFINIREKRGLCYFIKAVPNIYQDAGNLMIQAGVDKIGIDLAVKLIIKELEDIRDSGITEDELQRAKDYLAGQLAIQLEDSENIANYFGKQEILTGRIVGPRDRIKKIREVARNDVVRAASDIIKKEKINLAVIGPFKNIEIFKRMI